MDILLDVTPEREDAGNNGSGEGQIKHICIIGAGAAGLGALKTIMDTKQYKAGLWKPVAFEARDNVGGIWLPAPLTQDPPLTSVYDSLTTNIPHPVMGYTNFLFPPSTPLYPPASTVQTYLESYTTHFKLTPHIRFNTTVQDVRRDSGSDKWRVQISGDFLDFDLVIIANGHYRVPRYPDIPGLSRWIDGGKASHSAWYRRPCDFGEVVLVIGGGPSGQDISAEMRTAARIVIHSVTGGVPSETGNLKKRGRVIEFKDGGQVVFEDGITECGVDYCIIATGYNMSFPFLTTPIIQSDFPPPCPPLPRELYNSRYHVFPLAKHIFPLQSAFPPSSIAFLGLLRRVIPFPLVEAQARAVIKAFEDPGSLDTTQEAIDIITRYEEIRSTYGDDPVSIAKNWHTSNKEGEQFDYRDELNEFAEDDSGAPVVVAVWEKEMYEKKGVLRTIWRELERTGEASEWVKGVGEGGVDEWVALTKRLLKRAEENASVSSTSTL